MRDRAARDDGGGGVGAALSSVVRALARDDDRDPGFRVEKACRELSLVKKKEVIA